MDDAERVGLGDRDARLQDVIGHPLHRHRSVGLEHRRQIAALQQLHHDVRRPAVERADVGDPADVLAAQLGRGPGLAKEALDGVGVVDQIGEQELERDRLLQVDVGGADDHTHPATADHAIDAVLAREQRSDLEHREESITWILSFTSDFSHLGYRRWNHSRFA